MEENLNTSTENPNKDKDKEQNPIILGIKELSGLIKEWIDKKYSHDKTGVWVHFATVTVILLGIIILSCKLDNAIIGTLLGSLIGFAFGNFPKNGDKNSK